MGKDKDAKAQRKRDKRAEKMRELRYGPTMTISWEEYGAMESCIKERLAILEGRSPVGWLLVSGILSKMSESAELNKQQIHALIFGESDELSSQQIHDMAEKT